MTTKRASLLIACGMLWADSSAFGMGFGTPSVSAVLGQPLEMLIPLTLEGDDRLGVDCLFAEVESGDAKLAPAQVTVDIVSGAGTAKPVVRVRTFSVIEEPVLQVRLAVNCNGRFTRQFMAFADPPAVASALAGGLVPPVAARAAGSEKSSPQPLLNERVAVSDAPTKSARESGASRSPGRGKAASPPSLSDSGAFKKQPSAKLDTALQTASAKLPTKGKSKLAAANSRLLLDVGNGPSLKMDLEAPIFLASAASAAAAEIDADPGQLLQKAQATLGRLKEENAALLKANQRLRSPPVTEVEESGTWVPWLLMGAMLLSGVGLGMWLRGRSERRKREEWWAAAQPAADRQAGPETLVPDDPDAPLEALELPSLRRSDSSFAAQEEDLEDEHDTRPGADEAAISMPVPLDFPSSPAREVSVEELLDLEQQADFFIALGQEDAAVEVLVSSLDGAGGQSPVPYTKLLEIYRQIGNRPAYDEIRDRFNRRFNVNAPAWNVGPHHGRSLEDYPATMKELTSVWAAPLDAMAVLEGMLFRRDPTRDLFDLPAYRDLLLMYSIARENWQQQGSRSYDIDLLLPLNYRSPLDEEQDTSSDGFQRA